MWSVALAKKKRTLANHLNPRFQRLRTFANVCERLKLFAKNLRKCIFRNSQRNFEHVQNFFANVKTVCERLRTFATLCEPLRTLKKKLKFANVLSHSQLMTKENTIFRKHSLEKLANFFASVRNSVRYPL